MASSTERKKEAAPLEEAFTELLKTYRIERKFQEKSLIYEWGSLVGQTIADRTQSVSIRDKKLIVKFTSGPIKKEIQLNKSKIILLIEERFGAGFIEDLICL